MKPKYIKNIVRLALAEDIGKGDITTNNLIPRNSRSQARLVAKADGVLCGVNLAREVFKTLSTKVLFKTLINDGQKVRQGDIIADITGPTRVLLSGERVAINLLSFLSGIATQTKAFVDKIKPYKANILDTRKTTPLLRHLERYAVRTAGGVNHRFNLNDMVMIKDNHRVACEGQTMVKVIDNLKNKTKHKIVVEVDTLSQLRDILHSRADIILLDNMTPQQIVKVVKIRNQEKSPILLEASGGITLKNVKKYAATGVERISIGALTHSRQVLDISMEFMLNP